MTVLHILRPDNLRRAAATAIGVTLAAVAGLLLARLTPLEGTLFVLLTVGGAATVSEPLVGLGLTLFLAPLWAYLRAEVPQVPAQIAQVFVALTLASWLARMLARREVRRPPSPLLLPLLVFVVAAWLSLWNAVELPVYGLPELVKWVQVVLLYLFTRAHLDRRRLPWLLGMVLGVGLFEAGVGIWQFGLRGYGPDHFAIPSLGEGIYRAYGTFEQPNPYAGFIGMLLSLAVGVVLESVRQMAAQRRVALRAGLFLLIALVMGSALVMSWSRGAWLGFGAALAVMTVAGPRRARWGVALLLVLAAGFGLLYGAHLLPASVAARLTGFTAYVRFSDVRGVGINDANYAVIERLAHWQAALEMFRYHPWTGVGFGCYEPAYRDFALINWPIPLGHAHNYYLNLAAETGAVGLAAYLLLWAAVLWQTWRTTRRTVGLERGVAIGLLGAWAHLAVHSGLDNLYVNNVHLFVGVLLGLAAGTGGAESTDGR